MTTTDLWCPVCDGCRERSGPHDDLYARDVLADSTTLWARFVEN